MVFYFMIGYSFKWVKYFINKKEYCKIKVRTSQDEEELAL